MVHRFICLLFLLTLAKISVLNAQSDVLLDTIQIASSLPHNVQEYKLANGFTVILYPDTQALGVFAQIAVKVGTLDEPVNAPGLLGITRNLLLNGSDSIGTFSESQESLQLNKLNAALNEYQNTNIDTEKNQIWKNIIRISNSASEYYVPNETARLLSFLGVRDTRAYSDLDATFFTYRLPSHNLQPWLGLIARNFVSPKFRGYLHNYRQRALAQDLNIQPNFATLVDTFRLRIYQKNKLGKVPPVDSLHDPSLPTLKQIQHFYHQNFHASNMALVITGNFIEDEIKPLIKNAFDSLPIHETQLYSRFSEPPFEERQVINLPYHDELNLIGYVAPKLTPENAPILKLFPALVSNTSENGLLDSLKHKKWLDHCQATLYSSRTYSNIVVSYHKKEGVNTKNLEIQISSKLDSLANGQFNDTLIHFAKKTAIAEFFNGLITNEKICLSLAVNFTQDFTWQQYQQLPNQIAKVNKKTLAKALKSIITQKHLYCKTKVAVSKPLQFNKKSTNLKSLGIGRISASGDRILNEIVENMAIDSANFNAYNKDISEIQLGIKQNLYYLEKKFQPNFHFIARYYVGSSPFKSLEVICRYLMNVGTQKKIEPVFKQQFVDMGSKYNFAVNDGYLEIEISGLNQNFIKSLELVNELIFHHDRDPVALQQVIDQTEKSRADEQIQIDKLGDALKNYLIHKSVSPYKRRIPIKNLHLMDSYLLRDTLRRVLNMPVNFHYEGSTPLYQVHSAITRIFALPQRVSNEAGKSTKKIAQYKEKTILFLHHSNIESAKIYYYIPGALLSMDSIPLVDAFNEYFSSNDASILKQVMYSNKGIACDVNAQYETRGSNGMRGIFVAELSCPAQNTNNVILEMNSLLKNMPVDSTQLLGLPSSLINACYTTTTSTDNITKEIHEWRRMGYSENPVIQKIEKYRTLTTEDVLRFFKTHLKNKPIAIAILANKKKINLKKLESFGKIHFLKTTDLFTP